MITDGPAPAPETAHEPPDTLSRQEADRIVSEAAKVYFEGCRARVKAFAARNFSVTGSLKLHRHAVGWDILRAPANAALSIPQVGLKLSALAVRGAGGKKLADRIERQHLLLETAVARELRWRIMTEILRQPFADGARQSREDAMAEAILAHPMVQELVAAAAETAGIRKDDPEFRARLDTALAEYTGSRAAASEITTALIAIGTGAVVFKQATPGAIALGPAVAAVLAQQAAVASFPLGASLGGLWYGVFPAQASPMLVAGATASLIGVAAITAAFAGVISDPVQQGLGLHERRLKKLIDSLEEAFDSTDARGYVAYDLYVARLIDLSDLLVSAARAFRV